MDQPACTGGFLPKPAGSCLGLPGAGLRQEHHPAQQGRIRIDQ